MICCGDLLAKTYDFMENYGNLAKISHYLVYYIGSMDTEIFT